MSILKVLIFLVAIGFLSSVHSITIMKKVGHGDCYVVIQDGRAVLIDAGPTTSVNGLVSLMKAGYLHFDRVVVTHVHSDHAGGLLTAERYSKETGSILSADMIVSNHGEHDLKMILNESTLRRLLLKFKDKPIVGLTDAENKKLSLKDESMELSSYSLSNSSSTNENKTSLIIKVTEIRDGKRCATLFLGDIEKSQQNELLTRADAKEIFKDVKAVTIPHHGSKATLISDYFERVKLLTNPEIIFLHSDSKPLDAEILRKANESNVRIESTAKTNENAIYLDYFGDHSFYKIAGKPLTLREIIEKEKSDLIQQHNYNPLEVCDAIAKYSKCDLIKKLKPDYPLTLPSDEWIYNEIINRRSSLDKEFSKYLEELGSATGNQYKLIREKIAAQYTRLSKEQKARLKKAYPSEYEKLKRDNATSLEKEVYNVLGKRGKRIKYENIGHGEIYLYSNSDISGDPIGLRYLAAEGNDDSWTIYKPGKTNTHGVVSPGSKLGVIEKPSGLAVESLNACEYCGKPAYGWCHIREKYVCEDHRIFQHGGGLMQCP